MSTSRRLARELALKGLYQWQLAGGAAESIEAQLREDEEFPRSDQAYFRMLLAGVVSEACTLETALASHLDRPFRELSPVERGILLLAGYELLYCPSVPYKVVINEAVEIARMYGGTDGYKYVNGVLDKLAAAIRTPATAP
jgi:N utilization substance protein B